MDGYALRSADVEGAAPVKLMMIGEVRAGEVPSRAVGPGEAMAIYTGAPVPEGADAVQMIEHSRRLAPDTIEILRAVRRGENITPQGQEAAAGSVLLEPGRVIGGAEMAILATFGWFRVPVWARPSVAIISTGDELVEPDEVPSLAQIRNSNAPCLRAQAAELGIRPDYLGIARDDPEQLLTLVRRGLAYELLILTGGVSMGEFDLVKGAFAELGVQIHFDKVAMRPGKPTVFATAGRTVIFGLPGNPVSAFVSFENFVRPALGRMSGFDHPELPAVRGSLMADVRQVPGRMAFLPARVRPAEPGWTIEPLPWKGSGDIIGFSRSNAMLVFPGERDHLAKGESAEAVLLPDFYKRRQE